jgi:excisionase family DNA binding protein
MTIKLHTVEEVAGILKVKEQTVYDYINSKKLPAAKIGKAYRISDEDLEMFVEERKK